MRKIKYPLIVLALISTTIAAYAQCTHPTVKTTTWTRSGNELTSSYTYENGCETLDNCNGLAINYYEDIDAECCAGQDLGVCCYEESLQADQTGSSSTYYIVKSRPNLMIEAESNCEPKQAVKSTLQSQCADEDCMTNVQSEVENASNKCKSDSDCETEVQDVKNTVSDKCENNSNCPQLADPE